MNIKQVAQGPHPSHDRLFLEINKLKKLKLV